MSAREDWEIVLYGSDAATATERQADVSAAQSRMSNASNYVVTDHGMREDGRQRGYYPGHAPSPNTTRNPVPSAEPKSPKKPEKPGLDPKDAVLLSLLSQRGKKSPLPPKIEIKNPAVPERKDNSIIVALIGAVALYMANRT